MSSLIFLLSTFVVVNSSPLKPIPDRSLGVEQLPQVDLGYEIYQGQYNPSTGVNEFLGIRFAASTEGKNRWQPPQSPLQNRDVVIKANSYPNRCPQSPLAPLDQSYDYSGTEDCLFLSVLAPAGGKDLPVLFYIHGGGYGQGQGNANLTSLMTDNGNGFITVAVQYRLGAFGFLASEEVHKNGVANAGLLDQHFALEWVQDYIHLFGGDSSRVTIMGESAGGGSVMLQAMAYGGSEGTKYFLNGIASSPYLPPQYHYKDNETSKNYYAFAQQVGCLNGSETANVFDCLVAANSSTLQNASSIISASGIYGSWAFVPVTDGDFIRDRPSKQLLAGQVNGLRILTGNNANEGPGFITPAIRTESDFENWAHQEFHRFNDTGFQALLDHYPSTTANGEHSYPQFATTGTSPPSALDVSSFATGAQQRGYNIYAEKTFVCPSYWLALAYSISDDDSKSYKYQYSLPLAQHGADMGVIFDDPGSSTPSFQRAFSKTWANFVIYNNPSISSELANGNGSTAYNPASNWPQFSRDKPDMLNFNETNVGTNMTQGNDISLQDGWTWEAGRGDRCDFLAYMGYAVPE